jgi:transketolase
MPDLNQRKAYGEALLRLGEENKNVVALDADLSKSTMSALFEQKFPERFFEMGIAEANMASVAAGLAFAGKIPFFSSFAVFATGRAYDPIRTSICIPKLNVNICGSSAGLSDFGDGKTHQSVEDMAIMRALPGMTVLCPADGIECAAIVAAPETHRGPAYVRVNRHDLPFVTPAEEPYRIGAVRVLRRGKDAAVFACGVMVSRALEAADRLGQAGISATVVNVSTVKPIDRRPLGSESPTTAKRVGLAMLDHASTSASPTNTQGHVGAARYTR